MLSETDLQPFCINIFIDVLMQISCSSINEEGSQKSEIFNRDLGTRKGAPKGLYESVQRLRKKKKNVFFFLGLENVQTDEKNT